MQDDRGDEDRAAILARRQRLIALALGGLAGCGPGEVASDGGTTTVASSTTGSTGTSTSTETGEGTETTEGPMTSSTTTTFVPSPEVCLSASCDVFSQDCPEGEKCVPYGSTGGAWDAEKCVQVTGEGAAGEDCNYGGTVDATDDCDEQSYCWNAQDVEGQLTGVCAPFCMGTPDDPLCDEGACLISNEGSVALCLDTCDPLMDECGEGLGCSWAGASFTFACLVTTEDIVSGEPCGYANDCGQGSTCLAFDAHPMCNGSACCADFCAMDDPDACPDPQLECAPFFAESVAPEGYENLGVCLAPGTCDIAELGCFEFAPLLNVDV